MPFHPVTAALMYRGIYTVPNLLSEQRPVDIPEDELEGECPARTPPASYLCAQVKRGLKGAGLGACLRCRLPGGRSSGQLRREAGPVAPLGAAVGSRRRRAGPASTAWSPALRKLAGPTSGVTGPRSPR